MKLKKAGKILMILVLVLALLVGGGFAYLYFNGMSGMSNTTEAKDGQIRIACVGDSTTYGTAMPNNMHNSYPAQLQRFLGDGYHVANFGVHGKTVQDTNDDSYRRTKQYARSLAYDPDIVVLMLGANDEIHWRHLRQQRLRMREIAGHLAQLHTQTHLHAISCNALRLSVICLQRRPVKAVALP